MKKEILEAIDHLKLLVMLDDGVDNTDLTKFNKFIDELLLRGEYRQEPTPWGFYPVSDVKKQAKYSRLKYLVDSLY